MKTRFIKSSLMSHDINCSYEDSMDCSYEENMRYRHGRCYIKNTASYTPGESGMHLDRTRSFYFKGKNYGEFILYRKKL